MRLINRHSRLKSTVPYLYSTSNMSDTIESDACGIAQYVESFKHNEKIISEMRFDELIHLENDLNLYEKVHSNYNYNRYIPIKI